LSAPTFAAEDVPKYAAAGINEGSFLKKNFILTGASVGKS
jgi:hypothetical protein